MTATNRYAPKQQMSDKSDDDDVFAAGAKAAAEAEAKKKGRGYEKEADEDAAERAERYIINFRLLA